MSKEDLLSLSQGLSDDDKEIVKLYKQIRTLYLDLWKTIQIKPFKPSTISEIFKINIELVPNDKNKLVPRSPITIDNKDVNNIYNMKVLNVLYADLKGTTYNLVNELSRKYNSMINDNLSLEQNSLNVINLLQRAKANNDYLIYNYIKCLLFYKILLEYNITQRVSATIQLIDEIFKEVESSSNMKDQIETMNEYIYKFENRNYMKNHREKMKEKEELENEEGLIKRSLFALDVTPQLPPPLPLTEPLIHPVVLPQTFPTTLVPTGSISATISTVISSTTSNTSSNI